MTTENTTVTRGNNRVRARNAPVISRALKWLLGAVAFAALSGTTMARDNVSFSISFGTPMPMYAPPVYVAAPPPPMHVRYGYPVPVYAPAPRVVYYASPYPAPRRYSREYGHGHGRSQGYGHGGEHRHGWR